ncbi:kinase-like protein [Pleomassaria siparia CBS 279.74]|uniref:non-specific serine/threonine protein kinase n=1 Tax=Pleomassaria siparia CBS 279.74 TaxID=1314801 RepID=A0A6G1KF93_9PLEO|nr:kinase-like protein [Pleomassaria siparia CBS 279.74]
MQNSKQDSMKTEDYIAEKKKCLAQCNEANGIPDTSDWDEGPTGPESDTNGIAEELLGQGYEYMYSIVNAGGVSNNGIHVVKLVGTEEALLCKSLEQGHGNSEAWLLNRLYGHPNIPAVYGYIPGIKPDEPEADPWDPITTTSLDVPQSQTFDRVFMEFCEQGSLENLIKRYQERRSLRIPESFIWKVLESLAEALRFCHTGENVIDDDAGPSPFEDLPFANYAFEWDPIIHRDIYPQNVFLTNDKDSYPRVVLGDFGYAISRSQLEELQSTYRDTPKQDEWSEYPTHLRDEANDVMCVGYTIWNMCYCTNELIPIEFMHVHEAEMSEGMWSYSGELRDILNRLISSSDEERMDCKELLASIQQARHSLRSSLPVETLLLRRPLP